jgi:transcriptional regulator with XRE-family HTH domain
MGFDFPNLKKVRKLKRIYQKELAEAINADQAQISDIENGKSMPKAGRLWKLARALDISMDKLMEGYGEYLKEQGEEIPEEINIGDIEKML